MAQQIDQKQQEQTFQTIVKYNLTCCPFIGIGTGIEPLVRLHLLREPFRARATCAEEGLEILAGFHFCSFACFPCVCTEKWRCDTCNLYKCESLTETLHSLAWKELEDCSCAFYCLGRFGLLAFE